MTGPVPPRPESERPAGPLALLLSCPKCGGPFSVDDTVVTTTCAHCGSLLLLDAPERDEVCIAEEMTAGPGDLTEMVVTYRVQAQRAEIVARHQDSEGNPPSEWFIQQRLEAYERKLRETVAVVDAHRVQVPYWHLTGRIAQCVLGRQGDGPKVVRVRVFAVEHTVPGYDTTAVNLRDRGLRMAAANVRPLTTAAVAARGPFLPWVEVTPQSYREIDRWKGQDLEPGLDAVKRDGRFLASRRLLVYRAYWLARVRTDKGLEWILADGQFATIAGYPDEAEVGTLLRLAGGDPLRSGGESFRRVTVVASRCPDCGFEARLDPAAHIVVCASCHLALAPRPSGVDLVPYDHSGPPARELDGEYVPFWRFEATVQVGTGKPAASLEEWARLVFPQGLPPGFSVKGKHLWVPAFRLLGTEAGDETFQSVVQRAHADPPEVVPGKIPVGGRPVTWGVSVSEDEARELAPLVLFALPGMTAAARLNALSFMTGIAQARLGLGPGRLVMASGIRVPELLLRGGPELDAQRVTVHRARAEADAARRQGGAR